MTTYMRSGSSLQYLHLSDCPRYGWLARLLRKAQPWPWADEQDRGVLLRLTMAMGIKHCRTCQPFGMRRVTRKNSKRSPR